MAVPTFEEIKAQIQACYQAGDYAGTQDIAERYTPVFPEQSTLLYFWRICMAARLGQTGRALNLFREILDRSQWYGETLLRRSPSLAALQGDPAFEQLVERNLQQKIQDQSQILPLIILRSRGECGPGQPPCPLLMALHSNASNALASVPFWQPAALAGWLVGIPQSTQGVWKDVYVWDDPDIARKDIQRHYLSMTRKYAADPDLLVVGGHSMGGEVAIRLALSGELPASGFLAIGPEGPYTESPDSWRPLIDAAVARLSEQPYGMRGAILLAESEQTEPSSGIRALVDLLDRAGIPCELEILPGADHEPSPLYNRTLLRALEWFTSEG